ncbi:MAG: SMC-Scp complex subunit ScpB [Proteobacteria bacterium]|nr:SMC-Scp complex subunit ScpB [Pseudomonadota bacterium]
MSKQPPPSMDELVTLEAVLFASPRPLAIADLRELTGWRSAQIENALRTLVSEYAQRGINIREVANGFQMVTSPLAADVVARMREVQRSTLSRAALETLAIIAYKQPVTRAQVESVRGVNVDHIITKLLDKQFIREVGHAQAPGRPALLGTTRHFLQWFGLKSIEDLPPLPDIDDIGNADIPLHPAGSAEG